MPPTRSTRALNASAQKRADRAPYRNRPHSGSETLQPNSMPHLPPSLTVSIPESTGLAQPPFYMNSPIHPYLDTPHYEFPQPFILGSYPHPHMMAGESGLHTPMSASNAVQLPLTTAGPTSPGMLGHDSHDTNHRDNTPWTPGMDQVLLEKKNAMRWDQIAREHFPDKTGNACRKRHARLIAERKKPSQWSDEKQQRLIDAYNRPEITQMFERVWRTLGTEIQASSQDVENFCLSQGYSRMKGKSQGHRKRSSQTTSHRSRPSFESDNERLRDLEDDEQERTDDSGIGVDSEHGQQIVQATSQSYPPRQSYHNPVQYQEPTYYQQYQQR